MQKRTSTTAVFILSMLSMSIATAQNYSTCQTWDELKHGSDHQYAPLNRISDPGDKTEPYFNGFWFYDEHQFDKTDRYALAMRVKIRDRKVTPQDVGQIGYIDLHRGNQWTQIGETTAWNWQQGCRLQWRPNHDQILWNDRSSDGQHFVCRIYDFANGQTRTLPRPIYDVSPDGMHALTHDFARMTHAGTKYVGIADPYADHKTPSESGIEKIDLQTGEAKFLVSIQALAELAFPNGYNGHSNLYIFREGWNPAGNRFITFVRNLDRPKHISGWSISADGSDIRFFYRYPSHHVWLDDKTILEGDRFRIYRDDGSGKKIGHLASISDNTDPTVLPAPYEDWILGDTYVIDGFQYLFLFHRPSEKFVPLAKLRGLAAADGIHRVDLHARVNRSGRLVCIDATHEGLGRQIYTVEIGHVLDNPPVKD